MKSTTTITDLPGLERFGRDLTATVEPFDAAELELVAETLDGYATVASAAAALEPPALADIRRLAARARAQAACLVAAEIPQDLQSGIDEACERLAGRHGRCAVTRISPVSFVIVGLTDDIEREWVTVRQITPGLTLTEKSTALEIDATRDRVRPEPGA